MANHSIWYLLLVLLALGAQLALACALFTLARCIGARRWPMALVVLASSALTTWLGHHCLPEQLPVCTDSVLTYLRCLGF